MIVISVVNTKGGVGKTTLASALAVRASQEGRVAMVDLDPQRSLIKWWKRRGPSDNPEIFEGPETARRADGNAHADCDLVNQREQGSASV